jgi:hypothetical protein
MKGQFKVNGNEFEPINRIKIKKDKIIELSIEKFNDEDPCIINETYCRNYICRNIMLFIENHHPEYLSKEMVFSDLSENVKEMLDYDEKDKITFK